MLISSYGFCHFCLFGTVSRDALMSDFSEIPESLFLFGMISRNMLMFWPMGSVSVFFQKYAHFRFLSGSENFVLF